MAQGSVAGQRSAKGPAEWRLRAGCGDATRRLEFGGRRPCAGAGPGALVQWGCEASGTVVLAAWCSAAGCALGGRWAGGAERSVAEARGAAAVGRRRVQRALPAPGPSPGECGTRFGGGGGGARRGSKYSTSRWARGGGRRRRPPGRRVRLAQREVPEMLGSREKHKKRWQHDRTTIGGLALR